MRHYKELAKYERDGFKVIVDKTYEEIHPRDCFETDDVKEICRKIDDGTYDWFMLRVRVLVEGLELASEYLGGCCYEDAEEVLTDGTADSIVDMALDEAKKQVYKLSKKFAALSEQVDSKTGDLFA
jgi:hypothetical protein